MSLAALIAAYHEADEPAGALRATLPIAGRTLLERQARLVAAAGAEPIVVLVERVTPAMSEAVDRLRGEGLTMVLARSAGEAAGVVEPEARLLFVADGLLAPEAALARLASVDGPALLTVPDVRVDDRYERIDAESRWAGLALVDGRMLRDTAAILGEWDLQSTLLRRAVQAGARQLSVRGEGEHELPLVAEAEGDLAAAEASIVEAAERHDADWVSRYLLSPIERAATRALMPTRVTPTALGLAATLLMLLSALAFGFHWLGLGLAFYLLATPVEGMAERLARLRLQGERGQSWWSALMPVLAAGVLLVLAQELAASRGWGCLALAGTIIAFAIALRLETAGREVPGLAWLAEPKGLGWLLLPFAVANLWGTGLTALAFYAAGSFFWAQRHVHLEARPASAAAPQD